MNKKIIALLLALVFAFSLVACSGSNEFGLTYTPDGSDTVDYIYYTEERVVYVIGGLMMANIDGETKMLEMALDAGDITVDEILDAAKQESENGDIDYIAYPDGSREYCYDGFKIIVLNTHLRNIDIYFVPSDMGYFDVINK